MKGEWLRDRGIALTDNRISGFGFSAAFGFLPCGIRHGGVFFSVLSTSRSIILLFSGPIDE
jgi:hypothetical protein